MNISKKRLSGSSVPCTAFFCGSPAVRPAAAAELLSGTEPAALSGTPEGLPDAAEKESVTDTLTQIESGRLDIGSGDIEKQFGNREYFRPAG